MLQKSLEGNTAGETEERSERFPRESGERREARVTSDRADAEGSNPQGTTRHLRPQPGPSTSATHSQGTRRLHLPIAAQRPEAGGLPEGQWGAPEGSRWLGVAASRALLGPGAAASPRSPGPPGRGPAAPLTSLILAAGRSARTPHVQVKREALGATRATAAGGRAGRQGPRLTSGELVPRAAAPEPALRLW